MPYNKCFRFHVIQGCSIRNHCLPSNTKTQRKQEWKQLSLYGHFKIIKIKNIGKYYIGEII